MSQQHIVSHDTILHLGNCKLIWLWLHMLYNLCQSSAICFNSIFLYKSELYVFIVLNKQCKMKKHGRVIVHDVGNGKCEKEKKWYRLFQASCNIKNRSISASINDRNDKFLKDVLKSVRSVISFMKIWITPNNLLVFFIFLFHIMASKLGLILTSVSQLLQLFTLHINHRRYWAKDLKFLVKVANMI